MDKMITDCTDVSARLEQECMDVIIHLDTNLLGKITGLATKMQGFVSAMDAKFSRELTRHEEEMQNTFNSYFQHLSAFKMQLNDNVTEQAGMQERINGDHHRELTKLCTTIEARLRNDIASLGHKLDETTGLIDHRYSDVSSQMDHQYTSILNRLDKYYEGSPKLVGSQLDMK